ncbi:MAG TPA: C39 family peptidase [Candidatus Limnocylindria bacterium]|nr:C39 family peptidase [Candidatus Limnocylindria bacterium]
MRRSLCVLIAVQVLLMSALVHDAVAKVSDAPSVSFARFDLAGGTADGVDRTGGVLTLSGADSGTWTSAAEVVPFAFDELVASWNATTPAGTWLTIRMRASGSGRTTKWYTMGIWTAAPDPARRTSVSGQGDADGFVAIDTFIRGKKAAPLTSYQIEVGLHREAGSSATPSVRFVGAMTSAASDYAIPSAHTGVVATIDVPAYSQETHIGHFPEYDGGGEAWCSPTSTAMILDHWGYGPSADELSAFPGAGHADGQVDYAARAVYDWNYQGAGNWPFNTAYAAERGLNGFVTRLRSLAEAERFIAAGIPLIASINGKLPGFYFGKTNGHLLTIVGFTANGDVISNDPAVPTNAEVRKVYGRADFEQVWLGGSAGIVYVIYPEGVTLPATDPGLPANW